MSNGVKIHYEVKSNGEPVILVHGLYSSAKANWVMPGTIAELAKHYQVIAFDNRGHGQSGKPETEDQYGVQMVEDVVRLMVHLHIQKAHVIGYSLGGMITLKLLTMYPKRVSSAVVGGMGWLKADSPLQHFWEEIKGHRNTKVPAACVHGIAKLAVTEDQIKAVRVPVTIIVGERDPCRRLYVEPLLRVRPDWPEHVIQGAGHINCVAKPDFNTQLEAALGPGRRRPAQ
jgi:pimeloyl-ACP methyl ester carboxylesterase